MSALVPRRRVSRRPYEKPSLRRAPQLEFPPVLVDMSDLNAATALYIVDEPGGRYVARVEVVDVFQDRVRIRAVAPTRIQGTSYILAGETALVPRKAVRFGSRP